MDDNRNLSFQVLQNDSHVTLSDTNDPDSNFFNQVNIESKNLSMEEARQHFQGTDQNKFSILNVNIRSMNKNFENFDLFY